jgi:hypothetical protein
MTESLRTLLTEIVDYAGLFPPSQVGMTSAVHNYAEYLKSENAWMLGRFITPINRLDEFFTEAESLFDEKVWRLSVISNENLQETVDKINEFNEANSDKFVVDAIEIRVSKADEIYEAAKIIPKNLSAYFEFPLTDVLTDVMTALAVTRQRAKIRTGGVTQDAFPNSADIIRFMRVCIAANVPFKATAGLHHPLKCVKPLTYDENAPNGTMHGFLNLFLSACFLRQDLNNSFVFNLINETNAGNLEFADEGVLWKEHAVATQTIAAARAKNSISFGSCSFLEPIEDLQQLSVIS